MSTIFFRQYRRTDYQACRDIFAANCPEFFAPNEEAEYQEFLDAVPESYEVCEVDGQVRGAFGLLPDSGNEKRLSWILLDPEVQGVGIGQKLMERVIDLGHLSETRNVRIAASHKSAPFFARFGAMSTSSTRDGWGPGMDRVDMVLTL